jgi:hypothetical protein
MADTKKKQEEQAQEQADTQTSPSSETPDYKSDRDELMQASQQFFRTLFRAGVHLALSPVNILPPEPREHFLSAGREFTRGMATLAHELADDFDKLVDEVREEEERD